MAEYAINSSVNDSTRMTPFELMYGKNPEMPIEMVTPQRIVPSALTLRQRMQQTIEETRRQIVKAQQQQKIQADRHRRDHDFKIGDFVWLDTRNLSPPEYLSRKLWERFTGPFQIRRKIGETSFELRLPSYWRIHPVFHVSLLRPYHENDDNKFPDRQQYYQEPVIIDNHEEFEVEKIIGEARINGKKHYLVKWRGYDSEDNTWEPLRNLKNARDAIKDYLEQVRRETRKLSEIAAPIGCHVDTIRRHLGKTDNPRLTRMEDIKEQWENAFPHLHQSLHTQLLVNNTSTNNMNSTTKTFGYDVDQKINWITARSCRQFRYFWYDEKTPGRAYVAFSAIYYFNAQYQLLAIHLDNCPCIMCSDTLEYQWRAASDPQWRDEQHHKQCGAEYIRQQVNEIFDSPSSPSDIDSGIDIESDPDSVDTIPIDQTRELEPERRLVQSPVIPTPPSSLLQHIEESEEWGTNPNPDWDTVPNEPSPIATASNLEDSGLTLAPMVKVTMADLQ
ncbi:MAG TPA: chromo domain-containing protein, partial [Candidatus Thermoplasmatota archaeon]|nr:chromo domain-containing protein [Candidatus Thermoplasmatota archaeon]